MTKTEQIINARISNYEDEINNLKKENSELKLELAVANAKLEVYERIDCITNRDVSIGFKVKNGGENN